MFNAINKMLKKEPLYDFEVFIKDYETYEEFPLISRYKHASYLKDVVKKCDMQKFFVNLAFFYIKNIEMYARKKLNRNDFMNFFACITFSGPEEEINELGFSIPYILVTRKAALFSFVKNIEDESVLYEYEPLRCAFEELGIISLFRFSRSITHDKDGDITCLYACLI